MHVSVCGTRKHVRKVETETRTHASTLTPQSAVACNTSVREAVDEIEELAPLAVDLLVRVQNRRKQRLRLRLGLWLRLHPNPYTSHTVTTADTSTTTTTTAAIALDTSM